MRSLEDGERKRQHLLLQEWRRAAGAQRSAARVCKASFAAFARSAAESDASVVQVARSPLIYNQKLASGFQAFDNLIVHARTC